MKHLNILVIIFLMTFSLSAFASINNELGIKDLHNEVIEIIETDKQDVNKNTIEEDKKDALYILFLYSSLLVFSFFFGIAVSDRKQNK